ncbi:MAG: HAD-IA family hydrolase [Hyphomicrobiales bacterium]|nr:HAD-IA family hydrolase [Hyphomicrobiales bacterium]
MALRALIFDVDGTLAETEEIHRAAFNGVFEGEGLPWRWDVDLYRELLRVTGGRERMAAYAERIGVAVGQEQIAKMHKAKNAAYGSMVRAGAAVLRPGVARLMDEAARAGVALAICTTTSRANIDALLEAAFGPQGERRFATLVCAEDAPVKKPAPDAYLLVLQRLGLPAWQCLAIEDSRNGLNAATAAGLKTLLTPSLYTAHENFDGAARVVADLGLVSLADAQALLA